ncbi:glycosyltransferase family 2 protein, partial [Candidatus Aerophobetes bacterium]
NNQAIRRGKGRYILLLNPDSIFLNDSLSQMIRFMDQHPEVGALGCKVLNADYTIQTSTAHFPNLFTEFLRVFQLKKIVPGIRMREKIGQRWSRLLGSTLREYLRVYWDSERVRVVSWATGACLLARRKAVEDVGLMDEGFFMYYEDTDWCYRMHQKGWKICYFPLFQVVHYVGESNGKFNPQVFVERQKSMYHYFRKHHNETAVFLLSLIVRSGLTLRLMRLLALYPFIKIIKSDQKGFRKTYQTYLKSMAVKAF